MRNNFTKFGASWKVFRYRTDDTFRVTHSKRSQNYTSLTHKLLVLLLFQRFEKPEKVLVPSVKIILFVRIP